MFGYRADCFAVTIVKAVIPYAATGLIAVLLGFLSTACGFWFPEVRSETAPIIFQASITLGSMLLVVLGLSLNLYRSQREGTETQAVWREISTAVFILFS